MSSIPCRYFRSRSGCRFGDDCRFSHSAEDGTPRIQEPCKFFLRGFCAAGDACRFEHGQAVQAGTSNSTSDDDDAASGSSAWSTVSLEEAGTEAVEPGSQPAVHSAVQSARRSCGQALCQHYAATGACRYGERCRHVHGMWCQTCARHALHPTNVNERQQHVADCAAREQRIAARQASQNVECCICLDCVMDKADPAQRQFGLLDCDHAFCLKCIRSWRSNVDGGADVESALRACPVCRGASYFVTPSRTWPGSPEEKATIRQAYMSRLASIDCKHFAYGDGSCPFGTSCFYRHADRDGVPLQPTCRWYDVGGAEGKPYRLSAFSEEIAALFARLRF